MIRSFNPETELACICHRCGGTGRITVSPTMKKVIKALNGKGIVTADEVAELFDWNPSGKVQRVRHHLNKLVQCGLVGFGSLVHHGHRRTGYFLKETI